MSFVVLNVANPETKPSITYDRFWIAPMVIHSEIGGDATAHITLTPYSSVTGDKAESVQMVVPNIIANAANKPAMALALAAVMEAIRVEGIARGLIAEE